MIKVAFLIPKNKNCGVHDYSEKLFKKIMINNKSIKMKKVYYDYSNNPLYYFLLAKRLSKNYDLIHLQHEFALFGKYGFGVIYFLLGINKKLIITFHEFHKGIVGKKENYLLVLFKNKISKCFVLSNYAKGLAETIFSKEKIVNTRFGIEKIKTKKKFIPNLLVHPGFIRTNKNQMFTLDLAKALPNKRFILAGGGTGAYYEKVFEESKKINNIKITGVISKNDYFNLLESAEFVILPYSSVVQSAVVYDAIALRKKIITSNLTFFKFISKSGIIQTSDLKINNFVKRLAENSKFPKEKEFENYIDKNDFDKIAKNNIFEYYSVLGRDY